QYNFATNTAERLNQPRNLRAIAQLGSSSYGIHLGYFASIWMLFIFACLGIIGCVMLVAGALLWKKKLIKEQKKNGYRLVQQLNFYT
ncbi:PepSY domain-containing protein, partial [Acinetobacter baumannii]|uniref:PepSY domain-containing protein n=1 Tax=Acinetobacter baumannii TaxID=470 RepID=UPI003AF62E37